VGRREDGFQIPWSAEPAAGRVTYCRVDTSNALLKGETMRIMVVTAFVLTLVPVAAWGEGSVVSKDKAEMMGRVEDFFLHNFRDITWRKSLAWGDVQTEKDGARSISYQYEAKIWDKETMTMKQTFTFAADGKFIKSSNAPGFPMKKEPAVVDVTTQKGMTALVEDFFSKNFRDITARGTIEWGQVGKDEKGNSTIRYKYNATIWAKEKKVIEQVFTFDGNAKFVSVKDAPKP
jgi:hypothetical protein